MFTQWSVLITAPEALITVTADNITNIIQNNHSLLFWSLAQIHREASGRLNAWVDIFKEVAGILSDLKVGLITESKRKISAIFFSEF